MDTKTNIHYVPVKNMQNPPIIQYYDINKPDEYPPGMGASGEDIGPFIGITVISCLIVGFILSILALIWLIHNDTTFATHDLGGVYLLSFWLAIISIFWHMVTGVFWSIRLRNRWDVI